MTNNLQSFSLKKRIKSFVFALHGIRHLVLREHNARIHFLGLICVISFGLILRIELKDWISISIVSGLVFIAELFNTAIERIADYVEPKWQVEIKIIKDLSAGAVFIAALISLIVGGLVFIPKIWSLF